MDISSLKLSELIDRKELDAIFDHLYEAAGIPSAIIDMEGNVLTGAGWQRICMDFHRRHPEAEKRCIESDIHIQNEIRAGKDFVIYQCPHGLVDSCSPIIIEGRQVGNVFTGQMLHAPLTDGVIDRFKRQAREYGFDEEAYLEALREVPVYPIEKHEAILNFLSRFAQLIARTALTNLRRIEQARLLEESEEKFRALIDQASDAIYVADMEANLTLVNRQACESLGYSQEELLRMTVPDVDPQFSTDIHERIRESLAPGKTITIEGLHRRKDGSTFPVEVHIGVIEVGDRKSMLGIARDISLRKEFEESLRKSKREWEDTFDAIDDIITIQDREMRIVRANRAAHEIFRVEPGGLAGRRCYEVFRGNGHPCPNCPEPLTLSDIKTHSATITHDGLGRIFYVTSSPILNEDGRFTHLVHIARDVTEQKRLEEELFQAHKMEAIGTLAGGIAHDFNNILSAVLGYADLAKDDLPAGSLPRECIEQVLKAANRAKELVKQILTFSRKGQEMRQPFAPAPIIKEALKLMRASLPSTIEIREEIDPGCGIILASPTSIHQVVVNLCTNALHAMEEEKGVLTIKLVRVELKKDELPPESQGAEGMFVELMVQDTGCGMESKTLARIFEPYFTTREVGRGSGMGLALVHGIVRNSGGFIKVESEPGRGSAFHVYFPVVERKAAAEEEEKEHPLPRGNERILAVDDEELIVGIYQTTLEFLGYTVSAHSRSDEALAAFRAAPESFDLVLTDQTMPHLPGSDLAREILRIRPDIPIILCTGYSSRVSEELAGQLGIAKFAMKPLRTHELAMMVRELLDQRAGSPPSHHPPPTTNH